MIEVIGYRHGRSEYSGYLTILYLTDVSILDFKYFWDEVANEWKNADKSAEVRSENLMETEGEESVVGGLKTNESDKLNPGISKEHYSYENDTHVYTDPSDGSKYFWDKERSAWIPKVRVVS